MITLWYRAVARSSRDRECYVCKQRIDKGGAYVRVVTPSGNSKVTQKDMHTHCAGVVDREGLALRDKAKSFYYWTVKGICCWSDKTDEGMVSGLPKTWYPSQTPILNKVINKLGFSLYEEKYE